MGVNLSPHPLQQLWIGNLSWPTQSYQYRLSLERLQVVQTPRNLCPKWKKKNLVPPIPVYREGVRYLGLVI